MAKVFSREELPHFKSTRDTRNRMDLLTENVPVGATRLRADHITYHPTDTCAKHYHLACHHLFVVLEGEGLICGADGCHRLKPGMVAAVAPEELHWFENDTKANFKFVEFWAPPPVETVWVDYNDQ